MHSRIDYLNDLSGRRRSQCPRRTVPCPACNMEHSDPARASRPKGILADESAFGHCVREFTGSSSRLRDASLLGNSI